jgi:hypothetical protein
LDVNKNEQYKSKKSIMKKTKIYAAIIGGLGVAVLSFFLVAADHIDSPSVAGTTTE